MAGYALLEQDGLCARVSAQKLPTGRWRSWVQLERGPDYALLKVHTAEPHRVPNDYPDEARAVQAAYDYGRTLIARELEH